MSLRQLITIQIAALSMFTASTHCQAMAEKKAETKEPPTHVEEKAKDKASEPAKEPEAAQAKDASKSTSAPKPVVCDISKGFSEIAEPAIRAVVNVSTTQVIDSAPDKEQFKFPPGSPFEDFFREFFDHMERPRKVQAVGSGFIIQSDDKSALIVTNNHVVSDAKKISIFLHDGTEIEAKLHAADDRTDIAVLKVSTEKLPADKRKLPTLEWGDSNQSKVGDWLLAVGNPFGLGSTVTKGIISNRAREIFSRARTRVSEFVDDFIQHDAAINMGNSGGPVINLEGKVIGINTAIFSPSGGNVGIGFAVPSNLAKETVRQLLEFGRTKRGWLGVRIQHVTEDIAESQGLDKPRGAIVGYVTPGGPAEKAGLETGDIVLEFDGKEVNDKARLTRLVADTPVGKEVKVKLFRKGKETTLNLSVGEYEVGEKANDKSASGKSKKTAESHEEILGMKVSPITPQMKEKHRLPSNSKGIVIDELSDASSAFENGLRSGDVIEKAQHTEVGSPEKLQSIVNDAKKDNRKNILLLVNRNGEPRYVTLRLDDKKGDDDEKSHKEDEKRPAKKKDKQKS